MLTPADHVRSHSSVGNVNGDANTHRTIGSLMNLAAWILHIKAGYEAYVLRLSSTAIHVG